MTTFPMQARSAVSSWRLPPAISSAALLIPAFIAIWSVAALGPVFEPEDDRFNLLNRTVFQSIINDGSDDDESSPATNQPVSAPGWIASASGGECRIGGITISVPSGFTNEQGAVFLCNRSVDFSTIGRPPTMVNGTDFWVSALNPTNQNSPQTNLLSMLQIRITMDAAQFDISQANQLAVMMYNPSAGQWGELPSQWNAGTFQMMAWTQQLKPFLGTAAGGMFGRTVFVVIVRGSTSAPSQGTQPANVGTGSGPVATRSANLRSGPGTAYSIVGGVSAGQALQVAGKSADGLWYRLTTGTWIAAFLVSNAPANLPIAPATGGSSSTAATGTSTGTAQPQSSTPTANRNANLRAGPGTNYAVVGSVTSGQALQLVARNANGGWYRLATGTWIAAFLVDNAPTLPLATDIGS